MSLTKETLPIDFAGHHFILDASGALYWPCQKLLVIADLHLEKGSYFAVKANPLPLYDVVDTLTRIQALIKTYQPEKVISLGDNIHDADSFNRMTPENSTLLYSLLKSVPSWIWIVGNHDKVLYPHLLHTVSFQTQVRIDTILFTHQFMKGESFQIIGHFHPKVKLQQLSGPCFLVGLKKMILPAFGSYAGGFDIDSNAFKSVLAKDAFRVFLLYRQKIWRVR